jgi:hypothetical protein
VLETKYGKIIRATPQSSGTTALCRLPYTKKPSPIEPNSNPQRRADVSNAVVKRLTKFEGPPTGTRLEQPPAVHGPLQWLLERVGPTRQTRVIIHGA